MDDWLLYFLLAGGGALVLLVVRFLSSGKNTEVAQANVPQRENIRGAQQNRRIAAVRNRRAPGRRVVEDSDSDGGGGDENGAGDVHAEASVAEEALLNDPKLGAKKRAKLEAKIEKRAQREAEERQREEKKKRDAKDEEENKKKELEAEQEEKRATEEENRRREEAAQRELEEYLKMKANFVIEEEGCDVQDEAEEQNLLDKFVEHIKAKKVILFEELATKFGLKVPDAINRLTSLIDSGRLTGVMDDRGKFVYVSDAELLKFAKFIKQRGRVSVVDLVENSNQIIVVAPPEDEASQLTDISPPVPLESY